MNIEQLRQQNTIIGMRGKDDGEEFLSMQVWELLCNEKHKRLDETVNRFDKNIDLLFAKVDQIPIDVGTKFNAVTEKLDSSMKNVYLSLIALLTAIIGAIIVLIVKG